MGGDTNMEDRKALHHLIGKIDAFVSGNVFFFFFAEGLERTCHSVRGTSHTVHDGHVDMLFLCFGVFQERWKKSSADKFS